MGFEWDPTERAEFDAALEAHLVAHFPGAQLAWSEEHRRLTVTRADGVARSLWEPNLFFSFPSYTREWLFESAREWVASDEEPRAR